MTWIIWTCGWLLTLKLAAYLDTKRQAFVGPTIGLIYYIVYIIIWLIGMVKFW